MSGRSDHSFVGLWDLEKKELTYPEASLDFDAYPAWSPDGKKIGLSKNSEYSESPSIHFHHGSKSLEYSHFGYCHNESGGSVESRPGSGFGDGR